MVIPNHSVRKSRQGQIEKNGSKETMVDGFKFQMVALLVFNDRQFAAPSGDRSYQKRKREVKAIYMHTLCMGRVFPE